MKVKALSGAIMAITLAATSAAVMAEGQGNGTITFKGSIIDAPCSITQESQFQTVEMGQISNAALKDGGQSSPKSFQIQLTGCDVSLLKTAKATFSGTQTGSTGLLAISGTASGASLAIADHNGTLIPLGTESVAQELSDGDTSLMFSAYLQGDVAAEGGAATTIVPGEFETFANFTLAYQ